jgi:hypothetical protein
MKLQTLPANLHVVTTARSVSCVLHLRELQRRAKSIPSTGCLGYKRGTEEARDQCPKTFGLKRSRSDSFGLWKAGVTSQLRREVQSRYILTRQTVSRKSNYSRLTPTHSLSLLMVRSLFYKQSFHRLRARIHISRS